MLRFLFISWNRSAQTVKMEQKKLLQHELTPERAVLAGWIMGFCLAAEVHWNWTLHEDQGDHVHAKSCTCTQKPFFIFIHIPQSLLLFDFYLAPSVEEKYSSVCWKEIFLCKPISIWAWMEGKGDERLPLCKFIDNRRLKGCFWTYICVSATICLTCKIHHSKKNTLWHQLRAFQWCWDESVFRVLRIALQDTVPL